MSISDGFSLDGSAAEVVLAVMAWAAKMERIAINERAAAREQVEAEGGSWGRPRRSCDVERAKKLKAEGKSVRQISRRSTCRSRQSL